MILSLIIFITIVFFLLAHQYLASDIPLREFPILKKISYGVSLAAERGRPVIFSTGLLGLGPLMYACVEILKEIARKCARLNLKLLIPQNDPPAIAYINQVLQDLYTSEGKISRYDPMSIVFLSEEQFAFAAGYIGLLKRENVSTAFLFGFFAGEALILAESGRNIGAYQLAGSISPEQIAFFLVTCDDVAIGDEVYAISAKISGDKTILSNLRVADTIKIFCLIILIVGSLLSVKYPNFIESLFTINSK